MPTGARNRCSLITDRQLLTKSSPPPEVLANARTEIGPASRRRAAGRPPLS
jgi:hypothetical protein